MTNSELVEFYKGILDEKERIQKREDAWFEEGQACEWLTKAKVALAQVFPAGHRFITEMDGVCERGWKKHSLYGYGEAFEPAVGVFKAAYDFIRKGHLISIVEGIKAETVSEILDQALVLLKSNFLAAATVIAGGALETHLAHYCQARTITITGDGSIEKYNSAVGQVRKTDQTVYSVTDGKLVTLLGGMRNDAAHDPSKYSKTEDDVRRMIEDVTAFIARNP